jgi:hypothetical protein
VTDRSSCGCTWERQPGFGDVIVVQCVAHAAAGRTPQARRAHKAADEAVARLRREGKVR